MGKNRLIMKMAERIGVTVLLLAFTVIALITGHSILSVIGLVATIIVGRLAVIAYCNYVDTPSATMTIENNPK